MNIYLPLQPKMLVLLMNLMMNLRPQRYYWELIDMKLYELAMKLRPYIEKAAVSLSDEDALEAKELYPQWSGEGV